MTNPDRRCGTCKHFLPQANPPVAGRGICGVFAESLVQPEDVESDWINASYRADTCPCYELKEASDETTNNG